MSQCDIELVYKVEGSNSTRFVVIEPLAVNRMRSFRQIDLAAHEAGGVLIGERRGCSFVVKDVTTPFAKDNSSRFRFVRRAFHHQLAVIDANRRSGGTSNYLGEWHTHPQDHPYPSSIDLKNWKSSLCGQKPCLVAVVGRDSDWWSIHENGKFYNLVSLNVF